MFSGGRERVIGEEISGMKWVKQIMAEFGPPITNYRTHLIVFTKILKDHQESESKNFPKIENSD